MYYVVTFRKTLSLINVDIILYEVHELKAVTTQNNY
jgi:hypothetical protein